MSKIEKVNFLKNASMILNIFQGLISKKKANCLLSYLTCVQRLAFQWELLG